MGMGAAAGVGRAVQGMANSPRVQTSGQGKGAGAVQPTQPQVPAQGGKTAAPGTILNPNNPNNVPMPGGKAPGVVQPGQSPYTPIGLPPSQVPAQGGKAPVPMGGFMGGPGQVAPPQGGFPQRDLGYGNPPPRPTVPAQGGKGNMPLPADYQSRYGNYGFDSGLQNYLDQQYVGSTRDAGVGYQYDPTTQTFTGGTMSGQYNPIPLSVMQQAAAGNRDVLNPYFQSRFPQTAIQPQRDLGYGNQLPQGMPRPVSIQPQRDLGYGNPPPRPQVQQPTGYPQRDLGYGNPPPRPQVFPAQPQVMPRPVPQVMPRQPTPKPAPQVMPRGLAGLRGRR